MTEQSYTTTAEVMQIAKEMIASQVAFSAKEVRSILKDGPIVVGIADALKIEGDNQESEPLLNDEQVREFIVSNYPVALNNRQIKIGRITGSQKVLFVDWDQWTKEELSEEEYKPRVAEVGIETAYDRTPLSFVDNNGEWLPIQLFNFCQNIPEMAERMLASLDFLDQRWTLSQKRAVYALGILAHEFVHRLQTSEILDKYKEVAAQTWGKPELPWQGYPSEYAFSYTLKPLQTYEIENPQFREELILKEDMADTVEIYVTNSSYLKDHYPERFEFIQQHFPYLQPDSAQKYLGHSQSASEPEVL